MMKWSKYSMALLVSSSLVLANVQAGYAADASAATGQPGPQPVEPAGSPGSQPMSGSQSMDGQSPGSQPMGEQPSASQSMGGQPPASQPMGGPPLGSQSMGDQLPASQSMGDQPLGSQSMGEQAPGNPPPGMATGQPPGPTMPTVVGPSGATDQAALPSGEALNQLIAPIALYPDALVAQILAAAAFPVDIVEADRWLQQQGGLQGVAFAQAVDGQPWDPSVKALTQFPMILANMDQNLGWTTTLGEANAESPQAVLAAIQVMRQRAQRAGTLQSTPEETVTTEGSSVMIEPVDPNLVYLPEYDPWLAYGPAVPVYPGWDPYPGLFFDGPGAWFGVGIGVAIFASYRWGWHHWGADWHRGGLVFNHAPYVFHGRPFGGHGYAGGGAPRFMPGPGFHGGTGDRFRPGAVGHFDGGAGRVFRGNPAFAGEFHPGGRPGLPGGEFHPGGRPGLPGGEFHPGGFRPGAMHPGGFHAGGFHGAVSHGVGGGVHR